MGKKKVPKPQLTDEELRAQEARNKQARFRALSAWYQDTNSTNAETTLNAQARLYLQLQLRNARKERDALTNERKCCKASGDTEGVEAIKQKLKRIYKKLGPLTLLREDIGADSKPKMAKKWEKKCMTLEELLEHEELDIRSDFPADNDLDQAKTSNNTQASDTSSSSTQFKTDAVPHKTGGEAALVNDDIRDQDCSASAAIVLSQGRDEIWNRHEKMMKEYFIAMGLKQHVIDTRIAIQKSAFISQAKQELLINQAHTSLLTLCSQSKCIPIGYAEFISPTGGLWTLSSTKLWQVYEGRKSWEQFRWVPSSHLRICTVSGTSHFYLDFGNCSFTTGPIMLPLIASPYPLTASASCDLLGTSAKFEICFLGNANLKLWFPVHLLLPADHESETVLLTNTQLEFAGVFDGIF